MRMLYRSALLVVVIGMLASCSNSASTTPSSTPSSNGNSAAVNVPYTGGYGAGASSFVPGDVSIPVGGNVAWTNSDSIEHHPTADDGSWNEDLPAGGDAGRTFTTPGEYSYHCSIHPSMTGTITVK
jgi:plastocyanin